MSGERISFFGGITEDKLIYDERKKRFVHTGNMPGHLHRQYQANHFKSVSSFILLMLTFKLFIATT